MNSIDILKIAVKALDEKKALDLEAIEIGDLTIIADYFLLATATSSTHVRALAEEVEDKLSKAGVEPHHTEGRATGWILLDYGDVVIHVFNKESRDFYQLERLWNDGRPFDISGFFDTREEK